MSTYRYHINLDERGEFYADVRDPFGETVFEINTEAAYGLVEGGMVKDVRNPSKIKEHLVYLNFIDDGDEVISGEN